MKKTIYWAVTAKCGHVGGVSKYIPITFYVEAKTKKEASDNVIAIPRVKHHNKQVILGIENISYEEFLSGIQSNSNDPYLKCCNGQEQRCHLDEIYDRILDETEENCLEKSDRLHKRTRKSEKRDAKNRRYDLLKEKLAFDLFDYDLCTA